MGPARELAGTVTGTSNSKFSTIHLLGYGVGVAVVLWAVAIFIVSSRSTFFSTWTDENVHLYVANRVAQGSVLYRDIHSARPPLVVYPLAAAIKLGIAPFTAGRALSLWCNLTMAVFLFWAGRKIWGTVAGVAAFSIFLLGPDVAARGTYTGINMVALWTLVCAVQTVRGKAWFSGVSAGLALASGQHALVIVALCAAIWAFRGWRELGRFLLATIVPLALVLTYALARGGTGIWTDLIGHHLYHFSGTEAAKGGDALSWWFGAMALDNLAMIALVGLGQLLVSASPATAAAKRKRSFLDRLGPARLLALLVIAHLVIVATMNGGLALYLFIAVPFLALLAGLGVQLVVERAWPLARARQKDSKARPWLAGIALVVLAALIVVGWTGSRALYNARDQEHYPLVPQLRLKAMARLQHLFVADKLAATLRELGPDQTIFGFPTLVSLAALKAERRVAAEYADFAPRWIQHGTVSREKVIEAIERDRVEIFATPRLAFVKDPYFRRYLERCYQDPEVLPRLAGEGHGIPPILVFRHRATARPCK